MFEIVLVCSLKRVAKIRFFTDEEYIAQSEQRKREFSFPPLALCEKFIQN